MERGDCTVCGKNVYDDPKLLDFYELSRTYVVLKDGQADVVAPETVVGLTFCSPRCLSVYVATKIMPDAQGDA